MIDPETKIEHVAPNGMESHRPRKSANGKCYADLKMRHFIIKEHQEAYPELAERMAANPDNATQLYTAFLAILVLEIKGRLTPDLKNKIMKTYKVI